MKWYWCLQLCKSHLLSPGETYLQQYTNTYHTMHLENITSIRDVFAHINKCNQLCYSANIDNILCVIHIMNKNSQFMYPLSILLMQDGNKWINTILHKMTRINTFVICKKMSRTSLLMTQLQKNCGTSPSKNKS